MAPIHDAIRGNDLAAVMRHIEEDGASPLQGREDGLTPLYFALCKSNWETAECLLGKGASPLSMTTSEGGLLEINPEPLSTTHQRSPHQSTS